LLGHGGGVNYAQGFPVVVPGNHFWKNLLSFLYQFDQILRVDFC